MGRTTREILGPEGTIACAGNSPPSGDGDAAAGTGPSAWTVDVRGATDREPDAGRGAVGIPSAAPGVPRDSPSDDG